LVARRFGATVGDGPGECRGVRLRAPRCVNIVKS
jgi:hypothetical protein